MMEENHDDLVFYVKLDVKPEQVEEWKRLLMPVMEAMAYEEAFVTCTLHQSVDKESNFTLYERWREPSLEAFVANQMSKDYRKEYEERLPDLLESPRTASIVRCVQTWDKE